MPNRSQEENEAILLEALRSAGEAGLTLEQARLAVFGGSENSNSRTKKMLEKVKAKGRLRIKMGRNGPYYVIIQAFEPAQSRS
jgi:3-hydroxyisobutyrate dehydrogenase-like beta-hydroxyacid dehydrogenase